MALANSSRGRNGSKQAPKLLARLNEPEFRERMQLTEMEASALDRIASGEYVRNASAIIAAIKIKIDSAYSKQVQPVEVRESTIREVFMQEGEALTPASAGLPEAGFN